MVLGKKLVAASAVLVVGALTSSIAGAAGCNGVVDQLKWGCAAWDNNNGPQFPHYKGPQQQKAAPRPAPAPVVSQPRPNIAPNAGAGIVAAGGGNAVSQQRNQPQSGIVAAGGGNARQ